MSAALEPFREARERLDAGCAANVALVERLFAALGELDFEGAARLFSAEGIYHDAPVPDRDARGPAEIQRKLEFALRGLRRFVLRFSSVTASGSLVTSERVEDWHFPTGEVASLPVLCVHEIHAGRITAWREYWDLGTLMSQMPKSWIESYAQR